MPVHSGPLPIMEMEQENIDETTQNGKKFSKLQVAYVPIHYLLPKIKCGDCIFFEKVHPTLDPVFVDIVQPREFCQIVEGKIVANGICSKFLPIDDPPTFLQDYFVRAYGLAPPTLIVPVIFGAAIIGGFLIARRVL